MRRTLELLFFGLIMVIQLAVAVAVVERLARPDHAAGSASSGAETISLGG